MFENLHVLNFIFNHILTKPNNERILWFQLYNSDSIQNAVTFFSKVNREAGKTAQKLKTFTALAEDLGSVRAPTWWYTTIHNSSASGLHRHQTCTQYAYKTFMQIK